jgi:hypothetical protein
MDGAAFFSPDYFAARERFRTAARARGFRLEAYPLAQDEDWAQDLTIDVALNGTTRPANAVVVSCGLHGVEGFAGSAIQAALLEDEQRTWQPPGDTVLVLVHALNPFGFARLRRANEDNIDLNRNFLVRKMDTGPVPAPTEDYHGCHPLYAELDRMLNPRHPPRRLNAFWLLGLVATFKYDRVALRHAIVGGQYEYPKGIFFGGKGPSRTQNLLIRHLPEWIGEAQHVVHLDFHTGLGPWGKLQLLVDVPSESERGQWLARCFGPAVVSLGPASANPKGEYYQARGDLEPFCAALFADRRYQCICAEFGTYPALTVLAALRAENQAHHWGQPDDAATRRARQHLREMFAPADPHWRQTTVTQGLEIIRQAIEVCSA